VARNVSSRRGRGARSSAQSIAARATAHGLCEEIVLDPFSEKEVAEYVAKRSPSVANDEAFVRALHERTDGLPLFVVSIINEMSALAAHDGGVVPEQVTKIAVPENLAAIIEHYITKLENDQRTVLRCGIRLRRPVPHQYDCRGARARRRMGW
jgi:predicted ATPase